MREAAKQLKIEQEKKEAERRKVIGNAVPLKRNQTVSGGEGRIGHQPFRSFVGATKKSNAIKNRMM